MHLLVPWACLHCEPSVLLAAAADQATAVAADKVPQGCSWARRMGRQVQDPLEAPSYLGASEEPFPSLDRLVQA